MVKNLAKLCLKYFKKFLLIFLSIFCAFFLITLLITFIFPLFIYRQLILLLSKLFKPDFAKLVNCRSSICTIDDLYKLPTLTLLVVNTIQGDVTEHDLHLIKQTILTKMVQAKNPVNGQLLYPELQQIYESWFGLTFWKWLHTFNIDNHVSIWPESDIRTMDEYDIAKIRLELVRKSYSKEQSPWELIIIRNFIPTSDKFAGGTGLASSSSRPQCVFISRGHHGLCDGYSLLYLFINCAVTSLQSKTTLIEQLPKPNYIQRSCMEISLHYALAIIKSPYYITKDKLENWFCNTKSPFQVDESKLTRRIHPATTLIQLKTINSIRKQASTTFTAVILTGIANGFYNFLEHNNLPMIKELKLVLPLPWPNHPIQKYKLTNHWSFAVIKLPIGIPASANAINLRLERLKIVHKRWEFIKQSTIPTMNFLFVPLIGCLPNIFIKWLGKSRNITMILSNFPGPPAGVDFFGYPVLDASFGGGLGPGNLGIGMAMMSNNGILRMNIGVDHGILPSQLKVQQLIDFISEEIQMLAQEDIL